MHTIPTKYWSVIAIAAVGLIGLMSFHQLLFSGEVVNATDILTQQYFWNVFLKDTLLQDPCFRTWLPYINAGRPIGGGLNIIFQPVKFITLLVLPVHIAINYEIALYLLLLGVGMYGFMRELQVSRLASFLSALFLMLNGEIVSLINAGHVNKIGTIFPVTFVFYTLERALRRKTLSAFVLTGCALGVQFWQGHIQISYYTCLAVGIYFLIRTGVMYRREKEGKRILRLAAYGVVMVVVFLLLSAVKFLPLISFSQVSERAEGVSYEFATSWSMPPEELITYAIPQFFGFRRLNTFEDEDIIPYWGRMPFTQTGRYFGLLPLLFMMLALCVVRQKHVLTLGILALVVLLLGMGRYIPTYRLLYEYVPGFNMFRVPQMILFLFAFASSALAGFGVEWLFHHFSEEKERHFRFFLLACIVVLLFSWLVTMLLPQSKDALLAMFDEAFMRKGADSEMASARFTNIFKGILLFNVVFGMSLFVLGLRLVKHFPRWGLFLAILAVFLPDIWLFNEKYIDTIPLEGSHYINENDTIRYCKAHPGLYRILSLARKPPTYNVSNKVVYHKLFSVSGYEAVGVQYYNDYLHNMALGSALIDLLNIKYLVFPKGAQLGGKRLKVGESLGHYEVVMDADALLVENHHALPRAFPVHHAQIIPHKEQMFSTLLHPQFNPAEHVIFEETLPQNMLASLEEEPSISSSQSKVEITEYFNRTIRLNAAMADNGFLVLSERYYPGWKAYVNGQETPVYKANHTLQAIFLPRGNHEILFRFEPSQFMLGLWITLLTCLGLFGVVVLITRGNP